MKIEALNSNQQTFGMALIEKNSIKYCSSKASKELSRITPKLEVVAERAKQEGIDILVGFCRVRMAEDTFYFTARTMKKDTEGFIAKAKDFLERIEIPTPTRYVKINKTHPNFSDEAVIKTVQEAVDELSTEPLHVIYTTKKNP
ncbi:MAG: hypothetical protein WCY19_04850 [Candidatus Gastranaerophilaceae bacterium]